MDVPPQIVEAVEEGEKHVDNQIGKNYVSEIESFRSLAGDSDAGILEVFVTEATSGTDDSNGISPILLSPNSDKAHRTAMHNFFKEKFKFLVTDTVDGPDASSKCIRVRLSSGGHSSGGRNSKKRKHRGGKPFDSRGSDNWPEHLGKFLRFHLYKENKDIQEAIGLIGKMLGIQPRSFGFAGTKDKRSVSTQRVTVFKQHASRLAALNDRLIGIKVGDFCHVKEGLLLGQLLGNRFTVTLRGVVADSEDTIKGSAESLGKLGFINYFGLQLQCLNKCPGNYLQALKAIPRTLRMMYVHSYQSYLWNHAASMRVQKYGTDKVVVGDLVYCKEDDTERETAVTAEDLSTGNYSIDDVILPMPGSRVSFPMNQIANVYHDLAKKDGINLVESLHSVKEFSITGMTGSYSELLSYTDVNTPLTENDLDKIAKCRSLRPINEEEQAYGNENKSPSDCTRLPVSFQNDKHLSTDNIEVGLPQFESLCGSKLREAQTALKLSFILPASCYATMAIRELLKTSTSVAFHKTLNQ